jgi:hypothetical protein
MKIDFLLLTLFFLAKVAAPNVIEMYVFIDI